ncbi:MAG: YaaR family protein [Kyrpidia sp.]|nr:YaaR family protein [Kyrpidia sp.]
MRVDQTLTQWWQSRDAGQFPAAGESLRTSFGQVFQVQMERQGREQLEGALKRMDAAGGRLSERMSLEDLRRYKEALKEFLELAVRFGFVLKEETGRNRRGRPQLYKLLAVLDEHVLEMADILRGPERDRLRLLALIGEIRGLLVHVTV